ncbi:MAG: molybdenum cofactor guanylyltransferase [Methanoregulaceae archaeon]|nr:molybdenum cofactor guanylyltransferase [Methanoregulaceae archaeon]
MRSAIVLVGGEARRANGREKYFFRYQGKTFIERLIESLRPVTDEIVLVAKDSRQCSRFRHMDGVRCVRDIRTGIGPLGGVHAGVLAAAGDVVFICACDMPCVSGPVVERLFSALDNHEAVIPVWSGEMMEPLHAVYRRSALAAYLESHESLSVRAMVKTLDAIYLSVEELREFDPELITFTNINKLEELETMGDRDES